MLGLLRTSPEYQSLLELVLGNFGNLINIVMNVSKADDIQQLSNPYSSATLMGRHNFGALFLMANQITLSASEEMYLVTIRKICEDCTDTPIPIPEIAAGLDVQPVSVNQMVKKLVEMGLVNYTPYKGVELTPEGRTISNRILRHRRLWEVFLVRDLQMEVEAADALACHLEHITAVNVGDRLSAFLDHPTVCYHGDPIPQIEGASQDPFEGQPLTNLQAGEGGTLICIDADGPTADFLAAEGFHPGARLTVLAVGSRGEVLAESPQGRVQLAEGLAAQIRVGKSVP